jgi:hypothetical protein
MVPNVAEVTVVESGGSKVEGLVRLTNRPFACNTRWDMVHLPAAVRISSGS